LGNSARTERASAISTSRPLTRCWYLSDAPTDECPSLPIVSTKLPTRAVWVPQKCRGSWMRTRC